MAKYFECPQGFRTGGNGFYKRIPSDRAVVISDDCDEVPNDFSRSFAVNVYDYSVYTEVVESERFEDFDSAVHAARNRLDVELAMNGVVAPSVENEPPRVDESNVDDDVPGL